MKLYDELTVSISEIISVSDESAEFKARFSKLIENYFDSSYAERDINDVINMVGLTEAEANGD